MKRLTTKEQVLKKIKRKMFNEFMTKLETDAMWNSRYEGGKDDMELAQDAYNYAASQFFKICVNRGITVLTYSDPEVEEVMDHFREGGTYESYHCGDLMEGRTITSNKVFSRNSDITNSRYNNYS